MNVCGGVKFQALTFGFLIGFLACSFQEQVILLKNLICVHGMYKKDK
jgi:hypothetical protein